MTIGFTWNENTMHGKIAQRKSSRTFSEIEMWPSINDARAFIVGRRTIERRTGCWNWDRALNHGYGVFGMRFLGKTWTIRAQRLSYEAFIGPIPKGYEVDHLCRNRKCVNPAHFEAVTTTVNMRRSIKDRPRDVWRPAKKCRNGHEYQLVEKNGRIRRKCQVCAAARKNGNALARNPGWKNKYRQLLRNEWRQKMMSLGVHPKSQVGAQQM